MFKKFINEFKEFAFKGNVIDLAVGVMIGAAFGNITNSLVNDVFMPLLGVITGGIDFSNIYIPLAGQGFGMALSAAEEAGAVLRIGSFINAIVNFILIALCVFLFVKAINKLRKPKPAAPAEPERKCPYCMSVIDKGATRCPHCTSELTAAFEKAHA